MTIDSVVGPIITALAALGGICLTAWFGVRTGRAKEHAENEKRRSEELARKDAALAAQFKDIRADQIKLRLKLAECEAAWRDCTQKHLRAEMEIARLKALSTQR